jgi:dinuclear metal center YbgI/SA1388 family protein
MTIKELTTYLEEIAPLQYQESYDNAGLIVGDDTVPVHGVLVCLDALPEVIDEAISRGCNLVVAHHPIIFKGLKKIDPNHYIGRSIIKAIKHDIAIYAIHTNLDNVLTNGVNQQIAKKLQLQNIRILDPKSTLETFSVRLSMGDTKAMIEQLNVYCKEVEIASTGMGEITVRGLFHAHLRKKVEAQIRESATLLGPFKVFPLIQPKEEVGSGILGELIAPLSTEAFLTIVKETMELQVIRHTRSVENQIQKIAVCGGSGSFLLPKAIGTGADVYLSSDFKYHEFFEANNQICILDIGHYESEKYTIPLLQQLISRKFTTFAAYCTKVNTNPINYS